jgi:hypothetical protein
MASGVGLVGQRAQIADGQDVKGSQLCREQSRQAADEAPQHDEDLQRARSTLGEKLSPRATPAMKIRIAAAQTRASGVAQVKPLQASSASSRMSAAGP